MRRLMMSAAIAALALPIAACAGEKTATYDEDTTTLAEADETDELDAREPDALDDPLDDDLDDDGVLDDDPLASDPTMADAGVATTPTGVNVASLGATDISAKELLGEEIYGADGESIAHVDDVLIGANNRIDKIVYVSGGVGGVAGTKSTIPFNAVTIAFEDPSTTVNTNDPQLYLSATDDQMKAAAEFDQQGLNDYRLASEIIGTKIDLAAAAGDDDDAVVHDLIMAKDGAVTDVIVQRSVVGSVGGGDRYAFDYNLLNVAEGDGGELSLNVTEEQLNSANKFEYDREDAMDETSESMEDPDDTN